MDGYMQVAKSGGAAATCIMCLCGLACCAAGVTFMAYLGIYAFNNPNEEAWYGSMNGNGKIFETENAATAAKAIDIVDIHGRFVTWFLWGFIQSLLPLATGILGAICGAISPSLAAFMTGLGGCGIGCGGLAWYIVGLVWRFSAAGKFAAGDVMPEGTTEDVWTKAITCDGVPEGTYCGFQYSSANFMYIYYLITWIMMGVSVGCALIGAIIGCLCK